MLVLMASRVSGMNDGNFAAHCLLGPDIDIPIDY